MKLNHDDQKIYEMAKKHVKDGAEKPVEVTIPSGKDEESYLKSYHRLFKKALKDHEEEKARIQSLIDRSLEELVRHEYLHLNPTREFSVGDKVSIINCNWKSSTILEKYKNLFYLVEYTATENNYGRPYDTVNRMWRSWRSITTSTPCEEVFNTRRNNKFDISFHNTQIESLVSKYFHFGVDMDPSYQRGLVWTEEDKVKLIDSIFQGIEIGKFAFINLPYKENSPAYEILDGKQRLNAIIEFITDRFKYRGKFFSELSRDDQHYFLSFSATSGVTRDELTEKDKIEYFLRLNVGGIPQDQKHLEKLMARLKELS